jgi:O-antigen/teichoic acid export membrane protein
MMLIFAVLKIGLSLWLIPAYGILGAAIATSVLGVFTPLVSFTFVYRNMGATWPVLDTIKLAAASLIMGVAVYVLQSQIGAVPSLVLGIPLGIVIYIIAIFALGVVKVQDIKFLEGIQGSLPMVLRKRYVLLVGLMEKLVISIKQLGG